MSSKSVLMLDFEAIEISETISSIDGWVEMSMGE